MIVRFDNVFHEERIASLAKCKDTAVELLSQGLDVIALTPDAAVLLPDRITISRSSHALTQLSKCFDRDCFDITSDGAGYRFYSGESKDNALFITPCCNSNCVMCPSPAQSRKAGDATSAEALFLMVKHIPDTARHITITGGEPFLLGEDLFKVLELLHDRLPRTRFLLLTNGRALSIPEYCQRLTAAMPDRLLIGIPIHGHDAESHDRVTQAPGSFWQTVEGLKGLIHAGADIELRIVVSKITAEHLDEIALFIAEELRGVHYVRFIALEMLGSARANAEKVWIPYAEAFRHSRRAIQHLLTEGFDVELYSFPLCAVESSFRNLCAKAITDYKVRFADSCSECAVRDACGGIFSSSFGYAKNDIKPQRGQENAQLL